MGLGGEVDGYTFPGDQAMMALGRAISAEREHVRRVTQQLVAANGIGDFDAVDALARLLGYEAEGGYQDEQPNLWARLQG